MIKYLFILINSLSFFIYSLFSGDGGITVTSNIPKNITPGKEVQVEIKINKGSQSGFAKMQLELPEGLNINELDSKGANFSFVDGIAKWVWSSLPMDNEIIIKFNLVADAGASGIKTVAGKYSYVENNGKQVVEMDPVEVTIGEGAAGNTNAANTQTTAQTPSTTTNSTTTAVNTATTENNNQNPIQPNTNSEPSGNITVQRTIAKGNVEGEYVVNLKVNKGLTKGFARYSDDLPADMSAKAGKTEGASFSVSDGKIKFVWVAVPEKEELDLSYTITGVNKSINLDGEYSYLEQNQSKKYLLPVETITVASPQTANTNTATETNTLTANTSTETPVNTNTTSEGTVKTNTTTTETPTVTGSQPNETFTKKEGNVNYMVQIGAFTNSAVGTSRLSKKFNISEKIKSEMQGGFSKFMVGDHPEYKKARDHREKVRDVNKVATAFVVAYNTGKRITVQEALMISNQKWYK